MPNKMQATPGTGSQQGRGHAGLEGAGDAWDYRADNAVAPLQVETPGEGAGALGEFGSPPEVELGAELWPARDLYQDQTAAQYYQLAARDQINANTSWQSAFSPGPGYDPTSRPLQIHADGTQVSPNTLALNAPVYEPPPTLPPAPLGNTDAILSAGAQATLLPHQCIVCFRVFPSNNKLDRHIRGKHWPYSYQCWCGSTNVRKDNHLRHWEAHSNRGEHCAPATIRSSMMCGFCGWTTVDAGAHRRHVQSCGDGVPGRPSGSAK